MIWWQNTDIMQLSCKCAWWTFCSTYSTYVMLQADSSCKNVRKLVHYVVPQKKICSARNMFFSDDSSFLKWSVHRPLSSRHIPHGTCSCICAYFVQKLIFTIVCAIVLAITCTIVQMIFSVCPGFEPLALKTIYFCGSRVQTPARAAWSFSVSRVWFPGPDCLFLACSIRGLHNSPPQMEQRVAPQNKQNSHQR